MKKYINQKRYDTETAKKLGSREAGVVGSLGYLEETLYRKKTGEFFLHGEGGARTIYSRSTGYNSWAGGEKIIPLTDEAAREWAEEHLDADRVAEIFSQEPEDPAASKRMFTAYLSGYAVETIKREAEARGISQGAVIESWARMARD